MGRPITPLITVDIVIEYQDGIVLIERKNEPYGWAVPGGFVDVGEALEQAAVREAKEETALDVILRDLLYVYGKPSRDPRGHTVSVVYIGKGSGELKGGDDAKRAQVFSTGTFPEQIVFDHKEILADYFTYVKTGRRPLPHLNKPR